MKVGCLGLAVLASCLGYLAVLGVVGAEEEEEREDPYLNSWVADIRGGPEVAKSVAEQHGYQLVRALRSIPDHYELRRSDVPHRSRRSADHHTVRLVEDSRVEFVRQQQQNLRQKREQDSDIAERAAERELAREVVIDFETSSHLNDPQRDQEWYLDRSMEKRLLRRTQTQTTLGVRECWQQNITGKGVVVTILDDGLERDHPDLEANYDEDASYDFNDDDEDPYPRYDPTNENKHGTRCGGEISMIANNGICGSGIAFDARIGGVRMLDGHVTDSLEGDAIGFHRRHIDIYSASWGPNDDGKTTEGPGPVATKAFDLGIREGRDGKGALYVWASGNGGGIGDNCNNDGYTSSIYTMSISSATEKGHIPWYGEKCSSSLATTYSSGASDERKIISADLHHKCTSSHSGTSAAAPMAAGLFALLLEANPDLTWRDVQHIATYTSIMGPLNTQTGWYKNGAGYCLNLAFGHGLLNAQRMVALADPATWVHVGEQHRCDVTPSRGQAGFPQVLTAGNQVEVTFRTDGCQTQENVVNFLEHVQVVVSVNYTKRGNIYAELESPMGTVTPIMLPRPHDTSSKGFQQWPLMSTHQWGEDPSGVWKVRIADNSHGDDHGLVDSVGLVLWGTEEQPEYQKAGGPKDCQAYGHAGTDLGEPQEDPNIAAVGALKKLSEVLQNALSPKPTEAEYFLLTERPTYVPYSSSYSQYLFV